MPHAASRIYRKRVHHDASRWAPASRQGEVRSTVWSTSSLSFETLDLQSYSQNHHAGWKTDTRGVFMHSLLPEEAKGTFSVPQLVRIVIDGNLWFKCDRQYPCDRCSRRRLPEHCVYASSLSQPPRLPLSSATSGDGDVQTPDNRSSSTPPPVPGIPQEKPAGSSLVEVFGYYGSSQFNIMALVRKVSRA